MQQFHRAMEGSCLQLLGRCHQRPQRFCEQLLDVVSNY